VLRQCDWKNWCAEMCPCLHGKIMSFLLDWLHIGR
jgi:hypothetical protein